MTNYEKGKRYKLIGEVLKVKKGKATVIEINGDRYTHKSLVNEILNTNKGLRRKVKRQKERLARLESRS